MKQRREGRLVKESGWREGATMEGGSEEWKLEKRRKVGGGEVGRRED